MPQFTDIYLYIRPDQYRIDNCRATVSGDGDLLDMIEPHINAYRLYSDENCVVAKVRLDRNTPYRFRRLGLTAVEGLTPEAIFALLCGPMLLVLIQVPSTALPLIQLSTRFRSLSRTRWAQRLFSG